jgi:nitrite reductase/ring-hydroxylating ferredoxin subunit
LGVGWQVALPHVHVRVTSDIFIVEYLARIHPSICTQFINLAEYSPRRFYGMSEGYVKVGQAVEFPVGSLKKVVFGGEGVLVANVGGKLYAIANTCTHRGGPLDEGEIEGNNVICPWHGGQFDVTTGKVVGPPPTKDEILFDVRVEGSDVMMKRK